MKKNLKTYLLSSSFSIAVIGFICLFIITLLLWKTSENNTFSNVIEGDGRGYYAYLPNTFLNKSIKNQKPDNRFFLEVNRKGVNKYYVGTAVAMSPFFMAGNLLSPKHKEKTTGYEPVFQKSMRISGIFYLLLGLVFLRLFLIQYSIPDKIIILCLFLITFGTNLFSYSLFQPAMSHVYSWGFITGFLYFTKKLIDSKKMLFYYLAILFLGMIVLIRPLNGLIILAVPFLAGSLPVLKESIKQTFSLKSIFFSIIIFSSVLFIQLLAWKIQSGDWIVWSYQNEGFYFENPQFWNVLFSFRKGLFIYSPLVFFSLFGLYFLYKKSKFQFYSLLIFFFILTYFISSWWNWYYGPSFGQRPFVEFYGLIGLLLAISISQLKSKRIKLVFISIGLLFIGLNFVQTYQYHVGIISSWDMNFKKYRYTFLKTSEKYKNCLGGNNDILLFNSNEKSLFNTQINFEHKPNLIEFGKTKVEDNSIVCDYSNTEFNFAITVPCDSNFMGERGIYAKISLEKKDLFTSFKNEALFVVDISDSTGKNYHYYTFPVNEVPPNSSNSWKSVEYSIEIPIVKSKTDRIKMYVWNKNKDPFYLDNIKIEILKIN